MYYTYSQTSAQVSSLSSQNAILSSENENLQNGISNLQTSFQRQVSSLGQQVSVLDQRTLTVITQTNTVIDVQTSTTTSVSTAFVTTTSTVYPIPTNVTVYLVPSGQLLNYAISTSSYDSAGSLAAARVFAVGPVYQGQTIAISITLNCPGSTGPTGAGYLYLNGALVSQTAVACGGTTSGQISYVL